MSVYQMISESGAAPGISSVAAGNGAIHWLSTRNAYGVARLVLWPSLVMIISVRL